MFFRAVALALVELLILAAPAEAIELTARESVALALKQNRQLAADGWRAEAASRMAEAAGARLLPRLDLGLTASRTDSPLGAFGAKLQQQSVTAADFSPAKLNNPAKITNYQPRVTLSMPLWQGGALWAGREQAGRKSEAARLMHDWMRQRIMFETIRLYAGVLNARAQLEAAEKAAAAAQRNLENTRAMRRRGMVLDSDEMSAEVHRLQAGVHVNQARNALAAAEDALRRHLGLRPGEPLALKSEPKLRVDRKAGLAAWIEAALARRPDLRAMEADLEASRAGVKVARAGFLPHVGLSATQEWNNNKLSPKHGNTTIAAVVSMNLFSGGADKAQLDRAHAEEARASLLLEDARQRIADEMRDAWRRLDEAAARRAAEERALQQAAEALRIVRLRHRQGLEKTSDLLTAQSRLDHARASAIQARFDEDIARARLLLVRGALNEEAIR